MGLPGPLDQDVQATGRYPAYPENFASNNNLPISILEELAPRELSLSCGQTCGPDLKASGWCV